MTGAGNLLRAAGHSVVLGVIVGVALAMLGAHSVVAQETDPDQTLDNEFSKLFNETVEVSHLSDVEIAIAKSVGSHFDVTIVGTVVVAGEVTVSESALALIDNQQVTDDGLVTAGAGAADLINAVVIDSDVLQASSGNIGLNLSSGDNILQQNSATISTLGLGTAGGASDAEVFSNQASIDNVFDAGQAAGTVVNRVELLGGVLEGASGNIGLNAASGAFHIQNNALAMASAAGTVSLAEATAASVQQAAFGNSLYAGATNQVVLGQGVLANATGNIGINLTAGNNNVQQNTLVLSSGQ